MTWFEVDKKGLARIAERKGKARTLIEAVQNSWDAPGTTQVTVTLTPGDTRGQFVLRCEDDSPVGFDDLAHAYLMFAPSAKVNDPSARGRFATGEKHLLSLALTASIVSTTGGYRFDSNGRTRLREKRDAGSVLTATIRLTSAERDDVERLFDSLLPPDGITTTFNGKALTRPTPVRAFTETLRTEVADADGVLRPTRRKARIALYKPSADQTPHLYEMGIPVVEIDLPWHVDIVDQKVPLNQDRDNITPSWMRDLRVVVLNETASLLTPEQATDTWVKAAAADDRVSSDAVAEVINKRFGKKVVAYDPSDPQANAEAVLKGYTVLHGRTLSKGEWEQVRKAGVARPAGQVTPSNSTVQTSPDGVPPIPQNEWTPGMEKVAGYARALAQELLGHDIKVSIYRDGMQGFLAAYGDRGLMFNLKRLGHRWFDHPDPRKVDALLLHEFAHARVSDHLSENFHDELCRLGALLRDVTVRL